MEESERGRLYFKRKDGSEMAPFIIKTRVLYIGSGDSCGIRIYTDGIYPEHCALTIGKKGKVYFEPLHPTALALVNQDKITKKCLLKQDDVITVLVKSFRFAYPANSVHSQISAKTPILPTMAVKTVSPKRRISSARKSVRGIGAEQNVQKKKKLSICDKRVRFGPRLTPEEFDKHLPPSSPLRRGSLPGETHSLSIMKQRLSFQLSPNVLKRKKVSVKAKSSESKRSSFPLQSAKLSRGSPLIDKSLNIANESSSTFTVNVEVHSGQKSVIKRPIQSIPSHKKSSSFTFMESGDLGGASPYSVPTDSITKVFESSVSKNTPLKFNKSPSNLKVDQDVCGTTCTSIPIDDIKISESPPSKKTSPKSDKCTISDLSAMDKRPLFSEILKKQKAHSEKVSSLSEVKSLKSKVCLKKPSKQQIAEQKISEKLVHRQILALGSTGHANSPDTIILRKRKITEVDDISDLINVRRSPRTPRRAKNGTVTISLEKLPEENVKLDSDTTPTQPRNSNKFKGKIFKNQAIQFEEMCNIETEEQQHDNIAVEQVEEIVIENITTSSKKGEKAKKNDIQLESRTNALFEQFNEEGMKQDIKATPNQLKKSKRSGVEFFQKRDSQLDDLCNIKISEKSNENEDIQLELSSPALFGQFHEEKVEQNIKATPNQQRKGRKSGVEFIQKPDSQLVDLCNIEKGGYSEKETYSKFQSCSPKYVDVKEIKEMGNKQPKRGEKLLLSPIENEDKKLENLNKPENITVQQTKNKKTNQPKNGRKQLQVPQENKNGKLEDLTTEDSLSNEKENEESLKLKGGKTTKRSRSKVAKVLNENEENQLKDNLSDLGESSEITVCLNSGSSNDVSVLRTTQEIVKTTIKNIEKPPPKKRRVKKDCSSEGNLKTIAHELSPCRRVTRSMAKKCAPK